LDSTKTKLELVEKLEMHRDSVNCLAATNLYLFSSSNDQSIRVWTIPEFKNKTTLEGHTSNIKKIRVDSSQKYLFSAGNEGSIKIWDIENFVCIYNLDNLHAKWIKSLEIAGRYMFSGSNDSTIKIIDLKTLVPVYTVQTIGKVSCILPMKDCLIYCTDDSFVVLNYKSFEVQFQVKADIAEICLLRDQIYAVGTMGIQIWNFGK